MDSLTLEHGELEDIYDEPYLVYDILCSMWRGIFSRAKDKENQPWTEYFYALKGLVGSGRDRCHFCNLLFRELKSHYV